MSVHEIQETIVALSPAEREALFVWFARLRVQVEQQDHGNPTAHELGQHLAGIIDDGPGDLATNKRYLEGLGERSMS